MGDKLKELRIEKGVSQSVVAAAIGISRSSYANYEINLREPSIDIIVKLCEYFNVSADFLLGLDD